jgi:nucleoside-diphosphate-sugar epimerase
MAAADQMRILILGGAGMLGHRLAVDLRTEFEVWTAVRGPMER